METQNSTKVATKWALIYTITAIVLTYAFEFLNADPNSATKYITYIPFIIFLLLTQKEYRDIRGGYLTFGEGFSSGFRYSLFAGLLLAVFSYIYLTILSPGVWQKILETTRTQLEDKNMSADQIDKAMQITSKYGPIFGAFGAAVLYAIFGAIFSLIGAAIMKKERSPFDIANQAIDPNDPTV